MIKISILFVSVITMFCFMIPGFVLGKLKLAGDAFAKNMSVFVMCVAQVAMLIHSFIFHFDPKVLEGILWVFALSLVTHVVFCVLAVMMFRKAPEKLKKVLRFGVIFSNAGYMGIPVISDVFGSEYVIYATIYIVWFNVFAFSIGRLIYTGDKRYVSIKQAIVNPAVIPILIGLVLYLTGVGGWVQDIVEADAPNALSQTVKVIYNVLGVFKNMVAPASMIVVGTRLCSARLSELFTDLNAYKFLFVRHFFFPAVCWGIMKILSLCGVFTDPSVMAIVLILSSTPAAANTTIFAELYNGDSAYAGKLVALSTVISVITMPIVALLLYI